MGEELLFQLVLLLEHALPLLGDRSLSRKHLGFAPGEQLELLLEQVRSFLQPPLLVARSDPLRVNLALELFPPLQAFFLRRHLSLPARRLGLAMGVGHNLLGERPRRLRPQPRENVDTRQTDYQSQEKSNEAVQGN